MPTISQLVGSERKRLTKKTKSPALKSCPERRGVCTRVYTSTPTCPKSFISKNIAITFKNIEKNETLKGVLVS